MLAFFQAVYEFLVDIITSIIQTINDIISLITTGVESISSVTAYTNTGMVAVRGVIEYMPAVLFTIIAGTIAIILLIAVIRVFVG